MHTLWARIGQSRTCCKRFSTAALAQPSATTPLGRRVGLDDVLAAGFSTVAFASAVVDGNKKDTRKEKWARAIREEKRELHALQADQERRIANLEQGKHIDPPRTKQQIANGQPHSWQDMFAWADAEIQERKELGFEHWQGIPLSVLRNASPDQIQDFLDYYANHFPRIKGLVGPEVWNSVTWPLHIKKIRTLEWSIARLVLELLRYVPTDNPTSLSTGYDTPQQVLRKLAIESPEDVTSSLQHANSQLNTLKQGKRKSDEYYHRFPSPQYPRYHFDQTHDPSSTEELNTRLYSLFEFADRASSGVCGVIPSICYHLLTSASPPNIHTFNLLFSEFAFKRQDQLIRPLLASIYRSHVRPNEITLAETLRHYVRTNDRKRFYRYVSRMDGFYEGLEVAHPDVHIPDLLAFHYRVRRTPIIHPRSGLQDEYYDLSTLSKSEITAMKENAIVKIYEKPRRNLEVHRVLIQGSLLFDGLAAGLHYYRKMVSEGWEPDQDILFSVLHHCAVHAEWDAGLATWSHLQRRGNPIDERGYMLMLQLCQRCDKQEVIQEVLRNGVARDVLPPTVLEMDWGRFGPLRKTRHNSKALTAAKKALPWVRDLEQLMHQSHEAGSKYPDETSRMNVLANQINNAIPRPSLKTVSLLHEARALSVTEQKHWYLDSAVDSSSRTILNLVHNFKNIHFSTKVRGVEAQLQTAASAIAGLVEQLQSILLPITVRNIESKSAQVFENTQLFLRTARRQWRFLQCGLYHARFYAICRRTFSLRYELSPYVLKLHSSHIDHIQTRIGMLGATIKRTAAEIRLFSRAVDSRQVALEDARADGLPSRISIRKLVTDFDFQPSVVSPLDPNSRTSFLKFKKEPVSSMNDFCNTKDHLILTTEPRQAIRTEGQADLRQRGPLRDIVKKCTRTRITNLNINAFWRQMKRLELNIRAVSTEVQSIVSSINLRTLDKRINNLATGIRAIAKELTDVSVVIHDESVTLERRSDGVQMDEARSMFTPETRSANVPYGGRYRMKDQTISTTTRTRRSGSDAAASRSHTHTRAQYSKSTTFGSSINPALVTDCDLQYAHSLRRDRRQSSKRIDPSQWDGFKVSMSALEHG